MSFKKISSSLFLFPLAFIVGCSSSQKQRLEMREKLSQSSGMYCEFISGDVHNDIDVELNLQMARRCDSTKPYTLTNYKNSSENFGVIYCCSLAKKEEAKKAVAPAPAPQTQKPEDQLDDDEPLGQKSNNLPGGKDPLKEGKDQLNNLPGSKPSTAPAGSNKPSTAAPSSGATNKAAPASKSTGGSSSSSLSSPSSPSASSPGGSAPSASSPSSSAPSAQNPSSSAPNANKPTNPTQNAPSKPNNKPDLNDILDD